MRITTSLPFYYLDSSLFFLLALSQVVSYYFLRYLLLFPDRSDRFDVRILPRSERGTAHRTARDLLSSERRRADGNCALETRTRAGSQSTFFL